MRYRLSVLTVWLCLSAVLAAADATVKPRASMPCPFPYHIKFPNNIDVSACGGQNFSDQEIIVDMSSGNFDEVWQPGQLILHCAGQFTAGGVTGTLNCVNNPAITGSINASPVTASSSYSGTYTFNGASGPILITPDSPTQPYPGVVDTAPGQAVNITLAACAPFNRVFHFLITGQPANGTISNFDTIKGSLTYTPHAGFNGPADVFSFTCDDGSGNNSPSTNEVITINGGQGGGGNHVQLVSELLTPNPSNVGDSVTFSGQIVTDKTIPATAAGTVDWGDGSATLTLPAADFVPQFKSGFKHTFAAAGVFDVHLKLFDSAVPESPGLNFDFPQIVGNQPVSVDASTGIFETASISNGDVKLSINAQSLDNAAGASTVFEDAGGNEPNVGQTALSGFNVDKTLGQTGLYVATTNVLDADGNPIGKSRKTVGIGDVQAGNSGGLPPPMDASFKVSALKGKFVFSTASPDALSFSASVPLAAGFSLSLPGADQVEFSMGNVVDTMTLSPKGKSTGSARKRVKTFQVSLPKLPNGIAKGGELAKIKASFNTMDLTKAGFDTEGITPSRSSSETGQKSLTRFIQVNMVLAGVSYDSLIPVTYVLGKDNGFGTISARH